MRPWRPQVFQRQLSKEGLQQVVNSNAAAEGEGGGGLSAAAMSSDELRDLFQLRGATLSDTYDAMCADDGSDVDIDDAPDGPVRQEAICKEQARCVLALYLDIASAIIVRHKLHGRVHCMHSTAKWPRTLPALEPAPSCLWTEGSLAWLGGALDAG